MIVAFRSAKERPSACSRVVRVGSGYFRGAKGYSSRRAKGCSARKALSLLEIVLAIGLAAIAISILGRLISIGNQSAVASRDQSKAQMIAQSIIAEQTSGVAGPIDALTPTSGTWEADPTWTYKVNVGLDSTGLMNVITVSVEQTDAQQPTSFTLTQWIALPPPEEEEEETDTGGGV